jgi:hypothetical protein
LHLSFASSNRLMRVLRAVVARFAGRDEAGAKALDLLTRGLTDIESVDDGAEPWRSLASRRCLERPCGRSGENLGQFSSQVGIVVDRPKANLRKFRGYSSDCQNQKYEAISEGFVVRT